MMTLPPTRLLALVWLAMAGVAHAQNTPRVPNAIAPHGGIARGVIRPSRPVDSTMVKRPPTSGQHKMPVIRPPGIAR